MQSGAQPRKNAYNTHSVHTAQYSVHNVTKSSPYFKMLDWTVNSVQK